MYRDSYYEQIINLIKKEPLSQTEIHKRMGKDKISLQGIVKHLNRGVEEGKIIFLGNKVNKRDARFLLKYYFKRRWPFNAWQFYIYVQNTEKFYQRLKYQSKKNFIDREIILFYSLIELASMFQYLEFNDPSIIRNWFKIIRKYKNEEHIFCRIKDKKEEVINFYNSQDKKDRILNILDFTPLMYWCAFRRVTPIDSPEYNSEKDLTLLREKLIENLKCQLQLKL